MSKASATLPLTAETIAIGTELLIGGRSDSNSLFLADELGKFGIAVRFKSVVGDERQDIVTAIHTAVTRAQVIIMTGGLGPTVDDCTREAVAHATGHRLGRRKEALEGMTARLAQWGRRPSLGQLRQAMIPSGATVLKNPVGSAPGFCLTWKKALIVSLPGVPREMEEMMRQEVLPLLRAESGAAGRFPREPIVRQVFHTFGLAEADVDAKLKGLIPKGAPVDLGLLASPMGVLVSLTTKGTQSAPEKNRDLLQKLANDVRSRLRDWLFAEGRDMMEEVVGRELAKRGLTIAVAESCTGGLIGHRLTQVAGSSAYVDRAAVCYSNRAKTEMLGVPAKLIAQQGAVSKEVAAAMACGIRERANVSVGLSVTGIAGPSGGTETKPVGLVYVGLDDGTGRPITQEFRFHGDRNVIKQRSSQAALDLLRRWLLDKASK
jgi:nicotinamide-nucleotide amidase